MRRCIPEEAGDDGVENAECSIAPEPLRLRHPLQRDRIRGRAERHALLLRQIPHPDVRFRDGRLQLAIHLRSEEHTSELQSHHDLVCRLLLEKKKHKTKNSITVCTTSLSTASHQT